MSHKAVVQFPGSLRLMEHRRKLADEVIITFPFSKEECKIINAHLRERSPEICIGIADPVVREIVERFIEYVWQQSR